MKKTFNYFLISFCTIFLISVIYVWQYPKIRDDKGKALAGHSLSTDSLFLSDRGAGNISLLRFKQLLLQIKDFDTMTTIKRVGDTLIVSAPDNWATTGQFKRMFFDQADPSDWNQLYKKLPLIYFKTPKEGFKVNIVKIKGKDCVYIPYELIYNAIEYYESTVIKS